MLFVSVIFMYCNIEHYIHELEDHFLQGFGELSDKYIIIIFFWRGGGSKP